LPDADPVTDDSPAVKALASPRDGRGYLALAAATVGDRETTRQYATVARDTATRWGWHAYVDWLDEARDRLGF